jgi:hypothetical protein
MPHQGITIRRQSRGLFQRNLPLPDLYKSAIAVLWLAEDSSVIAC